MLLNLLYFKVLHSLKDVSYCLIYCVTLPKNKQYTTMKKDKKTGGTDKRYVSSLEKKVAKLESEVKNLKAGRKQLKEDLQKERKKKDVQVIELNSEQEQFLLNLLKGTPTKDS